MPDLEKVIESYLRSSFYKEYKDTYFSDAILKNALKCEIPLHRLSGQSGKSYDEILKTDVEVMKDFFDGFVSETAFDDEKLFWKMLNAFYIDPDAFGLRELDGTVCSADALISLKRIFLRCGISREMIDEYEKTRKIPIFYFPREKNGINMTRASVFGDRIDYTLFDLKRYFEAETGRERERCRLIRAYRLPKTRAWLDALGSFDALADWLQIKGVFVNKDYEVYEIESGRERVIAGYPQKFGRSWSGEYYENLKRFSERFAEEREG